VSSNNNNNNNNNNNTLFSSRNGLFVVFNARCKNQIRTSVELSEIAPCVRPSLLQSALKRKTLENRYYNFYEFRFTGSYSNIFQRV
jgi:hypothetical protein